MGNVAKYQHGWNMTFTVVELLMIIPKSTYLSISLPYFSIYHFFSLTLYKKYGVYNGQLGVALEDGSFFIYGVEEKDKQESGLVNDVKIKQLYPNEESEKEGDNNFGKIVDVLYKIGNANQIVQYDL